jgi:predicted transcriptional regulator
MKDGLLFASKTVRAKGAKGVVATRAGKGQDVAIRNIEGVMGLEPARVMIGQVPSVQDGGSGSTDSARLKKEMRKAKLVGAIGTEALVTLLQTGMKPDYLHGVREAAIEAAYCGLPFLVVSSDDNVSVLVQRLEEENLHYLIVDLRKDAS